MGKMVRCKFKCLEKSEYIIGYPNQKTKGWSFKFGVVSGGSEENDKFFAATPSGEFRVSSVKEDLFEVGKEYYLDISLAE